MLQPKKMKYRLIMRGSMKAKAARGSSLSFGEYGLKALEYCWLKASQIEAARKVISGFTKKGGKMWIRVFPDKPISKKPPEVRMGGGKAPVEFFAAVVAPGKIIFELSGVDRATAFEALIAASRKLPIKAKFVEMAF